VEEPVFAASVTMRSGVYVMYRQIHWGFAYGKSKCRLAAGAMAALLLLPSAFSLAPEAGVDPATAEPTGCYCVGRVGNVDCDYLDQVTLVDIMMLVDHLFVSHARLPNLEEANASGDPEGNITLLDVMVLVDHLFISGADLPKCPKPHNNPPVTRITEPNPYALYINSLSYLSPATGVRAAWTASDADHPYIPPTFEFEYRMYGPYPDSLFDVLTDSFVFQVFIGNDGQILKRWASNRYVLCDTIWLPGGVREISCDTVLIDTLSGSTWFGRIDTLLDVEAPGFVNNPDFNRVAASSWEGNDVWTTVTRDSLYDLFADYPSDTTREDNFIFWVRARDPVDPTLYDPTPAFRSMKIIDPKFERDVLVASASHTADDNSALRDTARAYWDRAIDTWIEHSGLSGIAHYDTARDYVLMSAYSMYNLMLPLALRYKTVIVFQDASVSGSWYGSGGVYNNTVSAISCGVNAWVAARVAYGNHPAGAQPAVHIVTETYRHFFGVDRVVFPGWTAGFYTTGDSSGLGLPRLEDFVGAYSQNPSLWPDLAVDTALLHWRYRWEGSIDPPIFPFYPFLPEIGALPQVGYVVPTEEAEVMYTYKSKYGPIHAITGDSTYEGEPVMLRLDRGTFRTVHSNFTPLSLEETTSQQMVDSVLSWLYEKWRDGEVAKTVRGRN
jgi:hypothetical protein